MSTPLWRKGALTNAEQAGSSGRCWLSRKQPLQKTHQQHMHMWNSVHSLSCDAGLYYQYEESWCVLMNTQIYPTGVIFHILCQTVQRNHFLYQRSITVLSWTKELLTCLEPDTGGKNDFRKASISYSKHRAAFKPCLPKAKPLLGRG